MIFRILIMTFFLLSVFLFLLREYNGDYIMNVYKGIMSTSAWKSVDIIEEKYSFNSETPWPSFYLTAGVCLTLMVTYLLGYGMNRYLYTRDEDYNVEALEELTENLIQRISSLEIEVEILKNKFEEQEKRQSISDLKLSSHSSSKGECSEHNFLPSEGTFVMESIEGINKRETSTKSKKKVIPECLHVNKNIDSNITPQSMTEASSCDTESITSSLNNNNTELLYSSEVTKKTTPVIEKEDKGDSLKFIEEDGNCNSVEKVIEENILNNKFFQDDIKISHLEKMTEEHKLRTVKAETNLMSKIIKENDLSETIHHSDIYPIEIQVEQCPPIAGKENCNYHSETSRPPTSPRITVLEALHSTSTKNCGDFENEDALSCRTSQSCRIPQIQKSSKDVADDQSKHRLMNSRKNYSSNPANTLNSSSVHNHKKKQRNTKYSSQSIL